MHYFHHKANSIKDLLYKIKCCHVKSATSEDPSSYLTGIKFKIGAENKGWIHAVENNRSIFDDLELQLILRLKVKMLCENVKTPIWHFDDGWRHEVICQVCL